MQVTPLLSHTKPEQIVAWQHGKAITVRQFLADVQQLAERLPKAAHVLNLCTDRYHFAAGLAASIIRNKISLLPPSLNSTRISQLKQYAPELFCLCDSDQPTIDLPQIRYLSASPPVQEDSCEIPAVVNEQCIAIVFTSGSTGAPQAHSKTWGMLTHSARAETARLGLHENSSHTLIGTVPPQHMYGLESTIMMAWQSGNALCQAHPFYPADICLAIASAPLPRVLISTPIHLRALLESGLQIPPLSLVISATAPLSSTLADKLESQFHAPLLEIYGTTETGIIATRRPGLSSEWQLLPGITLVKENEHVYAASEYITPAMAMSDIIEPTHKDRFLLHGRTADLVNIAGKRNSLANLNYQLNTIPGVLDGAYYMPDETCFDRVTRLAAFVVAPDLDAPTLLNTLRARIDPIFLPRPLIFVAGLPRNATGKLPRSALQSLLATHATQYEL